MTSYIYLYIISFFSYIFLDFLIKRGLLGNNFRNKIIRFQDNQIKSSIYWFVIITIILFLIILFIIMPDGITYYDEETGKAVANVQGNNINIHNPNINLSSSFSNAITSLGIGGTIAAGITSSSALMKSGTPLGVKMGVTALGGAVGGGLFIAANYFNTVLQHKAKPVSNGKTSDTIFSTKSALDGNENDSLNAVLGLFNINMMLNICILYLLIALAILFISNYVAENKLSLAFVQDIFATRFYLLIMKLLKYISKTNKIWMLITWVILIIACSGSICISYFILTHLDIISDIYQNSKK